MTRVLIVGAGITGAVAASLLKCRLPQKSHIAVWEVCKRAGGRMNTIFFENDPSCFVNLGAQYISPSVQEYSNHSCFYTELEESGLLQPMQCQVEGLEQHSLDIKHYIATKGMSPVVEYYLTKSGAETCYDTVLTELLVQADKFVATTSNQRTEQFDCVILTMPVPQLLQLRGDIVQLIASQPEIDRQLRLVEYSARYAVGLFLGNGAWKEDWCMKYFDDPVIRFICINGGHTVTTDQKTYSMVVHTTVPFGLDNVNCNIDSVCYNVILSRLRQLLPQLPASLSIEPYRWQYSQVTKAFSDAPGAILLNHSPPLVVGGDAFTYSKFDGCLTSAVKIVSSVCECLTLQSTSSTTATTESLS